MSTELKTLSGLESRVSGKPSAFQPDLPQEKSQPSKRWHFEITPGETVVIDYKALVEKDELEKHAKELKDFSDTIKNQEQETSESANTEEKTDIAERKAEGEAVPIQTTDKEGKEEKRENQEGGEKEEEDGSEGDDDEEVLLT